MSKEPLTSLEREVLQMLLAGDDPVLNLLREQLAVCAAESREMTGVGFYTKLMVPPTAPRLRNVPDFKFGDVQAEMVGLKHGAGFLLYVENGALDMLEGYTYDENWPDRIERFRVGHETGTRNITELRREWMA